ncbi:MAG TPA: hypothetical protein VKX34_09795 [Aequorivita sp.]|nr:hypothetical protein [Aequorivita sp.]
MKWYYLLVIILVSCSQNEEIENENWTQMVEYIDEHKHVYYIDENQLFQGDYIIYNENGEIAAEHKYKNAELIDTSKFYHLGYLNSIDIHKSHKNSKRSISYYRNGNVKGETVLFNNGLIHSYYQNDIKNEIIPDSSNFLCFDFNSNNLIIDIISRRYDNLKVELLRDYSFNSKILKEGILYKTTMPYSNKISLSLDEINFVQDTLYLTIVGMDTVNGENSMFYLSLLKGKDAKGSTIETWSFW